MPQTSDKRDVHQYASYLQGYVRMSLGGPPIIDAMHAGEVPWMNLPPMTSKQLEDALKNTP